MTEAKVLEILEHFTLKGTAQRAIQTAKQIGSSWPTDRINLIYLPDINPDGSNVFFRIVIE